MTDLESQSISNRYRLLARLDCGSSRVVHKAHDCVLDKVVAIKTLNDQSPLDQASLARFENEAKVLARVSHPHIAGLMDAGHQNGRPYLVLDYFSGRSLFDFLEERGEISLEKSIYLFVDLCLAVEYLHRIGVVHRNLNLRSVLVETEADERLSIRLVSFDYGRISNLEPADLATDIRCLGQIFYTVVQQPKAGFRGKAVDKFQEQAQSPRLSMRYGYGVLEKIIVRTRGEVDPYQSVGQIRRELLDMRARLDSWEDTGQGFQRLSSQSIRQTGIIQAVKEKEMDSILSFLIVWVLLPFAVLMMVVFAWLRFRPPS